MAEVILSDIASPHRRRFLGAAASVIAAVDFGLIAPAGAQAVKAESAPLDAAKHIDAGVLNVAYVEAGPPVGPAVILLHGWPPIARRVQVLARERAGQRRQRR